MTTLDGVIKFQLHLAAASPLSSNLLRELNAWRTLLHRLALIGRAADRYGGVGYGNVSQRLEAPGDAGFVISGTQTGDKSVLTPADYVVVTECDPHGNRVTAHGAVAPSSECLAHAALYACDAGIRCVLHVHSTEIWHAADALNLSCTPFKVEYGTPEMADAVAAARARLAPNDAGVIVMRGHEDGVIAFGFSVERAATGLLVTLAHAVARA